MISPDQVTAVLVTRGDVPMDQIRATLPYGEVIVWDNSQREDLGIFGRYAGITEASNEIIYVQDDDLLVTCHDQLLAEYEPGVLTVNYPHPWDIPWVARGALFDRDLPDKAFEKYLNTFEFDRYFTHYACDGVFGLLTENVKVVDYGSEDLPAGFAPGRVSTSPGWYDDKRPLIQERCLSLA